MKESIHKTAAIILAAGSGSRMGISTTKQRVIINGKSILRRSIEAFEASKSITSITVVCREDEIEFVKGECIGCNKVAGAVIGGKTRAESAAIGFAAIPQGSKAVMIHDAARCLITPAEIDLVADAVYKYGAATASTNVVDSLKMCDENGMIK